MKPQTDFGGKSIELDEIDYECIDVVVAMGLDTDMKIVAMKILTAVVEGDEMGGIEM
jgi:hypothetical protein